MSEGTDAKPAGALAVSIPEAAAMIGVGRRTAWVLVNCGKLKSFRVGKRVLIPRSAIEEFIHEGTRKGYRR